MPQLELRSPHVSPLEAVQGISVADNTTYVLAPASVLNMAQKCVHKGCGKVFQDPEEPCIYHPGPPEFHEGQKGRAFQT